MLFFNHIISTSQLNTPTPTAQAQPAHWELDPGLELEQALPVQESSFHSLWLGSPVPSYSSPLRKDRS